MLLGLVDPDHLGSGSGNSGASSPNTGINTTNPKHGGSMTVGTFSEVDGFYPPANHFDTTGYLYALTVYDLLFWTGADGKWAPYLAESISPNSSYDIWTMKFRPGIKFSDGSDLTSTVALANIQALKKSALTGPALQVLTAPPPSTASPSSSS